MGRQPAQELEDWVYKDSHEPHKDTSIFCDLSGSFHELGAGFKSMGLTRDPRNLGA
jgi:hypothetical protein